MLGRRGNIIVLLAAGTLLSAGAFSLVRGGDAPVAQADASRPAPAPVSPPGQAPRRTVRQDSGPTPKDPTAEVSARWMQEARALGQEEEAKRRELLDVDPTLPLEAQQAVFLDRLSTIAGVDPRKTEAQLVRSQATELFLRLEPVQAHLVGMSVEERRAALADIRRRMGYSEEQIARMAAEDVYKDARWEKGHAYMKAREALLSRLGQADSLDAELGALREQYFGHEASTLAREEAAGFFRYQRRRIYGRN
nr:hypothetical protein MFMH1_82260 [Myxococcus sp. MH1]